MNQNATLPASHVVVSSAAALCEMAQARSLQNFSGGKLPELIRRQVFPSSTSPCCLSFNASCRVFHSLIK